MLKPLKLLIGSSVTAQAISFISLPIILLYFDPENFGYFQLILSYAAILNSFSMLKLHEVSFYYSQVNDRKALYTLAFLSHLIFVTAIIFFYVVFRAFMVLDFLFLMQIICIATTSATVVILYTEANKRLLSKEIAQQRVVSPVVLNLTRLSFVNMLPNNLNLLISYLVSQACIIFILLKGQKLEKPFVRLTYHDTIFKLKSNYKFFLPDTISGILSVIRENYIILISASIFDLKTAGYVAIANRLLMLPVQHVSKPLLEIYKHEIYEDSSNSKKRIFMNNFYINVTLNGLFFSLLFVVIYYFEFLLPVSWRDAAQIILFLLPMYAVKSVVTVMSYNFYVNKKQFADTVLQFLWLVMLSAPHYFGLIDEITAFLTYFVVVSMVFYITYAVMSWRYVK